MNIFKISNRCQRLIFLFKRLKQSHVSVAVNSGIQKTNVGYPLNYFLEYEAKIFQDEDSLNQSLKIAILGQNIEKLRYSFHEQNYIMVLYRISLYLQTSKEKQEKAFKQMSLILTQNYQKIDKFSTCFTILYKSLDETFKLDKELIEPLIQHALKRMKLQYTFRDYGTMLSSFYDLIHCKSITIKKELNDELEAFIKENHEKIGFESNLQILLILIENKEEKNFDLIMKLLSDVENSILFVDFLKYFRMIRMFLKIVARDFFENGSNETKERILERIDSIVKGVNACLAGKIANNFQAEKNKEKYENLIIKEYFTDVSLLLKIYSDLKDLGIVLREIPKNHDLKFYPEEEFQKIFINENFSLSDVGQKQFGDCLAFYEKCLKNEDKDESIKKMFNILFSKKT